MYSGIFYEILGKGLGADSVYKAPAVQAWESEFRFSVPTQKVQCVSARRPSVAPALWVSAC